MSDQSTVPTSPAEPAPAGRLSGWLVLLLASLALTALDQVVGLPDTFQIFGDLGTSGIDPIQSNLVQLDLIVALGLYLVAPIVLIAWTPYLLRSQRAKNTFVK